MTIVWRLCTPRFTRTAFSGEGARLYGDRWNRKGVPMVYAAGSLSLAVLEMLVQDEPLRARYRMMGATLPANLKIESITPAHLPASWRNAAARGHSDKTVGGSGSPANSRVGSQQLPRRVQQLAARGHRVSVNQHHREDAHLGAAVNPVVDRAPLHHHVALLQMHFDAMVQFHVDLA